MRKVSRPSWMDNHLRVTNSEKAVSYIKSYLRYEIMRISIIEQVTKKS